MTPAQHAAQLWLMGKNTAEIAHIKRISEPEAERLMRQSLDEANKEGLSLRDYVEMQS